MCLLNGVIYNKKCILQRFEYILTVKCVCVMLLVYIGIEYVTRYTVLILLSCLSSLSMAAILIYEGQTNFKGFRENIHETMEFHIIFVVDVIINCLSIYFYFIFGKWLYHLSCCLCHSFIHSCCISLCI